MQQKLISLNPDLKRLDDDKYKFEVIGGHILVHQIPYLNSERQIKFGTLVAVLNYSSPDRIGAPPDHTIYFCGDKPHNVDGTPMNSIVNNSNPVQLTTEIRVDHYFSSKPSSGNYPNYYAKITTYEKMLSAQAQHVDNSVTAKLKN